MIVLGMEIRISKNPSVVLKSPSLDLFAIAKTKILQSGVQRREIGKRLAVFSTKTLCL